MASETNGKKMSEYTDIDQASELTEEQKAYYKEHASVTTYGKIDGDESTGNSNYNVKLSEISKNPLPPIAAGDTGKVLTVGDSDSLVWDEVSSSQPNYGEGLEYDSSTNTLKFNYFGSGGLTAERTVDDKYAMKVKAGVGIDVDRKGVNIDTRTATEGDVLTYHKNGSTDEVVWAAVPSGSTDIIGGSDGAIYGSGAYCYVRTDEHTIKVNNQNTLEADFSIIDGSGSVIDVQHGDGIHIGFDTTGATVGDVLTVDQYGAHWAAPSGGGGDSQIEYLDLTVELTNNERHLTSATKTLAEMSTLIQSGKQVIARVVNRVGSVITNITQIFIGDFYNGSPFNDGSAIWFGLGGSGSVPANTHYVTVTSMPGSVKWWSDLWDVSDIDEQ